MGFIGKIFGSKKDAKEAKTEEVRDIGFQKVKEALREEENKEKFQELKEDRYDGTDEEKLEDTDKALDGDKEKDIEKENFMKKCAEYAISVFESYEADDNVLGLVNKIAEFSKDVNLAWEFFWFIPAIYLRTVFYDIKFTDTVVLVMPDNRNIRSKLYDYKSYVIAVDVVLQSFQMKKTQEQIQKVLFLSEEFKEIQKTINNGSKPQNLEAKPMFIMAPVDYKK
jgi:hypothetical protein